MAQINVKIDDELKAQAEAVLNELGMTISEAIRIFLHKVVANDGLPFAVVKNHAPRAAVAEDIPNDETIAALQIAEKDMQQTPDLQINSYTEYEQYSQNGTLDKCRACSFSNPDDFFKTLK